MQDGAIAMIVSHRKGKNTKAKIDLKLCKDKVVITAAVISMLLGTFAPASYAANLNGDTGAITGEGAPIPIVAERLDNQAGITSNSHILQEVMLGRDILAKVGNGDKDIDKLVAYQKTLERAATELNHNKDNIALKVVLDSVAAEVGVVERQVVAINETHALMVGLKEMLNSKGLNTNTGKEVFLSVLNEYNHGARASSTKLNGNQRVIVRYGTHDYGANNQKEYDEIMLAVEKAKTKVDKAAREGTLNALNYYKDYKAGKYVRPAILDFLKYIKDMQDEVLVEKLIKATQMVAYIEQDETVKTNKPGESAYDDLYRGGADCNGIAYLYSAMYDIYGFRTRIVYSDTHAWCEVEIDGKWYSTEGGLTPQEVARKSLGVLIQPTY